MNHPIIVTTDLHVGLTGSCPMPFGMRLEMKVANSFMTPCIPTTRPMFSH